MKKIIYTSLLLMSMFIGINVKASDAVCVYKSNNATITCNLSTDSTPSCSATTSAGITVKPEAYNFSNNDFQDVANNKWKCRNEIYISMVTGGRGVTYTKITASKGDGAGTWLSLNMDSSSSSYGEDINDKDDKITYCQYGDTTLIINNTQKTIVTSNSNCDNMIGRPTYNDLQNIAVDSNGCPQKLYFSKTTRGGNYCSFSLTSKTGMSSIKLGGDTPITDATGNIINKPSLNEDSSVTTEGETIAILQEIYRIIKIAIPVLIVVLSIVDFLKVLLLTDDKNYKSAWDKFIKRIVVGIIFFILPLIVEFIIKYSGIDTEQSFLDIFK